MRHSSGRDCPYRFAAFLMGCLFGRVRRCLKDTRDRNAAGGQRPRVAAGGQSVVRAGHADLLRRRQQRDRSASRGPYRRVYRAPPERDVRDRDAPGGTEGDNLVKTWLATGEMSDIFYYNSGCRSKALSPTESLVDLSGELSIENMVEAYLPTVTAGDGIYGVPTEGSLGGGILYNKKIYSDLGLEVP